MPLKEEFLRLLREDEEFRLAVAGLLGLDSILKELKQLREDFQAYIQRWDEAWKKFLEENERRWEENNRRWEENNRRWEENNRRWEENDRRWKEWFEAWRKFLEDYERRWEENDRRWREFERWRGDVDKWRGDVDRWRGDVDGWRVRVEGRLRRIEVALEDLRVAVGRGFEHYTGTWVELWLKERGFLCRVRVGERRRVDGEVEVDVLCEDPLVVGEVTLSLASVDRAEEKLRGLLERAEALSRSLGRPVYARVLGVEVASAEVAEYLERRCGELGVLLVLGHVAG